MLQVRIVNERNQILSVSQIEQLHMVDLLWVQDEIKRLTKIVKRCVNDAQANPREQTAIERLEKMIVIGDALNDQQLFALAHEILTDDNQPVEVWGRALKVLDNVMGGPSEWEGQGDDAIRRAVAEYRHYACDMADKTGEHNYGPDDIGLLPPGTDSLP